MQAFSRTNRVEKETKPFGNIVCYRNLKKKTDDAIKLFSQTDKAEEVLVKDYDYYKDQFEQYAAELYKMASTPQAVDGLMDENDQAKFVIAFRELSKILLILKTFVEFSWEDIELTMTQQRSFEYFSWIRTSTDRTRLTSTVMLTVSSLTYTTETMSLNYTLEDLPRPHVPVCNV